MHDSVREGVIELIKEQLGEDAESLQISKDTLIESIGFNSISFIKLVVAIEKKFGFEFDESKLNFTTMKTVEDIVDYIVSKKS
jgi:acyl carrier protein